MAQNIKMQNKRLVLFFVVLLTAAADFLLFKKGLGIDLVTVITLFYLSLFVNFSTFTAWHNVTRCKVITGKGVALDYAYLTSLGKNAAPAMIWLHRSLLPNDPFKRRLKISLTRMAVQYAAGESHFWEWTYQKQQVREALTPYLNKDLSPQ